MYKFSLSKVAQSNNLTTASDPTVTWSHCLLIHPVQDSLENYSCHTVPYSVKPESKWNNKVNKSETACAAWLLKGREEFLHSTPREEERPLTEKEDGRVEDRRPTLSFA